jgi:hypothetical protein
MKFGLACELQRRLVESPPVGWSARKEAGLLTPELTRVLGYRPSVDLLLQSLTSPDRIWIEFEISRADPVANHTKFASAHLIHPLPQTDAFVSLVSNDIAAGRANLSAHAVFLLRIAGLRAFQMPLLPTLDALAIKNLNQGKSRFDKIPDLGMRDVIELTRPVGHIVPTETQIFFATNRLEALLNLHQWNRDMADPAYRELWGKRNIRYLVGDPSSRLFAPSKFCAYTRMPGPTEPSKSFTPTMTIPAYAAIEQANSIFDGHKARLRLEKIGFRSFRLSTAPVWLRSAFAKWKTTHQSTLNISKEACEILYP